MKTDYTLYGWPLSYFSGKLRGYLRYKGINFEEKLANANELLRVIPKKTGASVIPVLKTRNGEWLQDTTAIIERLESEHAEKSITPTGPRQRIAAQLIEIWADEYWVPSAMHYRWSFSENYALFEKEGGDALLPRAPKFMRRKSVAKSAKFLRGFLPHLGVIPEKFSLIECWTNDTLDELEAHFSEHRYLFGDRPSIGDFGLIGPLYAHLGRDPYPKRELIDVRPNLQAWIKRVHDGEAATGEWLANDELPTTLTPIFERIFAELFPMISDIVERTGQYIALKSLEPGDKVARSLPSITVPMGDGKIPRSAMPYTVWMMQRVVTSHAQLADNEKQQVNDWLATYNLPAMNQINLGPKLERRALATRLAK